MTRRVLNITPVSDNFEEMVKRLEFLKKKVQPIEKEKKELTKSILKELVAGKESGKSVAGKIYYKSRQTSEKVDKKFLREDAAFQILEELPRILNENHSKLLARVFNANADQIMMKLTEIICSAIQPGKEFEKLLSCKDKG